jgi:hypothetical protein
MKRCFLLILIAFSVLLVTGQDAADSIRMVKQRSNMKFYQGKKEYTFLELSKVMQPNQEAYKFYKQAKVNRIFNGVFFGTGFITACYGLLFGVGEGIEKSEPSMIWSGLIAGVVVGGGIMALSIPFGKAYKQNITKAVKYYNAGIPYTNADRPVLRAGISENGIAVQVRF